MVRWNWLWRGHSQLGVRRAVEGQQAELVALGANAGELVNEIKKGQFFSRQRLNRALVSVLASLKMHHRFAGSPRCKFS